MDYEQTVQGDTRTFFQRWRDSFFPHKIPEHRIDFMEHGTGYGLTTDVSIFLNWPDRLRVLVGGVIIVETTSNTEHDPGKSGSMAFVNIDAPRSKRKS